LVPAQALLAQGLVLAEALVLAQAVVLAQVLAQALEELALEVLLVLS